MNIEQELDAGEFGAWLASIKAALGGDSGSEVPCGACTACCASSQFVHIGPEETGTLAHIPPELLFPAPRLARGNVVMGYDEHGRCPMLSDKGCSIYEHRPRTCRTYDCRIFAASELVDDDADNQLITRQVARWRFLYIDDSERATHGAVRLAATYLASNQQATGAIVGVNATQASLRALKIHEQFLRADEATGRLSYFTPDPEALAAELAGREHGPGELSR